MHELVKRLRDLRVPLKTGEYDGADLMQAWCAMADAADQIESLTEAVARAEANETIWSDIADERSVRIEKQAAEIAEHDTITERQNALIRKQAERIERLEKALRPFAEAAANMDGDEHDGMSIWESPEALSLTFGNLRRARQALSPTEDE